MNVQNIKRKEIRNKFLGSKVVIYALCLSIIMLPTLIACSVLEEDMETILPFSDSFPSILNNKENNNQTQYRHEEENFCNEDDRNNNDAIIEEKHTQNVSDECGDSKMENFDWSNTQSHSHSYEPHYATRTIVCGKKYVVDSPASTAKILVTPSHSVCNTCGADLTGDYGQHAITTGHGGSHSVEAVYDTVTYPEQGHYEDCYTEETYIDYYYCTECDARK